MILVDTSVWVDHFRHDEPLLRDLLIAAQVLTHPFIIGELACGNLRRRQEILQLLAALPKVEGASHEEVLHLVHTKALYGKGLGWIDAHLLASALLNHIPLWTKDKRLAGIAQDLSIVPS
ncbi:MAG: type II toxin-antitoxin system VapC family toxin [Candidatus Aureabacteria bacterium]|nr:type II toxin-antitoxin system VapC family toxin [Candidatus Auribacterota bacterium]